MQRNIKSPHCCRAYQHFKPRSSFAGYEGLASRRTLTWASFAAGGSFLIWFTNREEIPYTGRMHCILVPTSIEQSIGESTFKQVCVLLKIHWRTPHARSCMVSRSTAAILHAVYIHIAYQPVILCFMQIRSEAQSQGNLLPDSHPYVKLIKKIGSRIAQKASDDTGVSGNMNHMKVSQIGCCLLHSFAAKFISFAQCGCIWSPVLSIWLTAKHMHRA